MVRHAFLAAALCLLLRIAAADVGGGLALHGESAVPRDGGVFALPSGYRAVPLRSAAAELYLRAGDSGLVVEWAGVGTWTDGAAPRGQGRLNELYADFSAGELDLSLGKKVMSSGIGYGFRPLDVVQREDRRVLFAPRLEGVPLIAVEHIDADTAWSLVYLNRLAVGGIAVERGPHEALLRHYRLRGDAEYHFVLHLHERFGPAPGAGFTWVSSGGIELHGAALWQPRFLRIERDDAVLAIVDPWHEREWRGDGKALLGFTWTGASGWSLIGEVWHDGEAMGSAQWRELRELAAAQRALLGSAPDDAVYGNLAWNLRAYAQPSPVQDNLLLRLSHDGERADPYLDLLLAADRGQVITLGLDWELAQGLKLAGGARSYGGPVATVYGEAPLKATVFIELRGDMVW